MRVATKFIIVFVLIVVILLLWRILTPKQKPKPAFSPATTETTKTPTQPAQIPQQPAIAVPEQKPVTKTEVTTETTKTPTQPAQIPQQPAIVVPEQRPVTKTEVTTETTKVPTQPAQIPQQPIIAAPEQRPVTKTEVTTESIETLTQPMQIPQYLNQATITEESTYLWLAKPYEKKQRIDYATNQIYYEIWQDSIFLGVEKVIPVRDYFVSSLYDSIMRRHRGEAQRTQSQGEQAFDRMGLIPDVELPKIPLFGEGSRINISGSDKITFGGRTTFTSGFTQTAIKPSLLPELKMDQALKVNLDGTIGERTKVLIDHDSEREQAGQNKISLSYTGTEDDILQGLEFGDTRLVIPSTAYTGDLPSRKGLFGVSGKAKLGGIDLYAIASREESQGETKEFLGQTVVSSDTIWDTDFLRRTFFWIGETSRVSDLKVYINDGVVTNPNAEPAIATVLYNSPESIPTNYRYDRDSGKYALKVRGQDYVFHEESNIIEFTKNAPLPSNWGVGVSYVAGNDTIGKLWHLYNDTTPILVLKMIKPRYTDTLSMCWNYELKNIYSLGSRDVKIDTIKILRKVINADPSNYPQIEDNGPKSGQTFLRILGLDTDNNGIVEWPEFDASRGYIIFPKEFPFADESLSVRDSIIYRKDALSAGEGKKYLIAISYSTAKGSFNLGQFDIEDGSEKVYVNGQQQTKDDYEINYVTGEIKFKKPLPPNASVKVTYEYRPLFSLAQKSLVGTRGEWKFGDNGRIGTSLFYRQEAMPETKASLGAEPFQRLIAETDLSYNYKSDFITSILQKVPLLHSQSTSNFAFASEGAISLPNPNTRGIAYLDDFEKTTLSQDVFTRGLVWQFSSVPVDKDTNTFAEQRLFWYNPTTRIRKDSIFGSGLGEEGKETVDYLKVIYIPTDSSSWAGMMTCASQSGLNLTEIENLEVVLRTGQQFPQNGKIHFTVATRIDEDAPRRTKNGLIAGYNNLQDKEDRNNNGILDEGLGEDTGLDTIMGPDADNIIGDDGNDDYDATNNPIGTEGNKRLDDEDLAGDGFSRNNDYYEYTISLNDSTFFTPLANNWKLLRIPLMDSTVMHNSQVFFSEGIPKWEDIRIVRLWFSGFSTLDTFDFYTISFVGSRWRNAKVIRPDTLPVDSSENVSIASISQKTDPTYISPFELHRDQNGVTEYEASLALSYDSIQSGHMAITTKSNFDNEDYRDYGTIKIYIHNDINDPNFLFRFGGDSLNYYEFRSKISDGNPVAGYDGWYEFEISLDTVVSVKSQKQGHDTIIGRYRVYGSPSLSAIGYQALGIINQKPDLISGSIWFDDIRLFNPRAEVGYGFQSNASFNLSDLASASVSFGYSDPNFRRFSEGRGVKTGGFGTNLGYTIRASLDKFFPTSWGLSIPISYSRSTSNTLPKYSTQYADLRLSHNDTVAEDEKSTSGQEQWALNNLSKAKSGSQILNYTLEALSYSMGQRKTNSKTLLNLDTSYARYATLDYRIDPDLKISILDNDIYLFPNSISAGLDVTDGRSAPYTRRGADSTWTIIRYDTTRAADVSLDVEYTPLEDFNLNYSYGSTRDLFPPDASVGITKKAGINMGVETDNEEAFGADYDFSLFDIIKPRLSYDGHYTETHPKLSGIYSESRNFDNNSTIDVSTEFDLPEALQKIGDIGGSAATKVFNGLSNIFQSIDISYNNERNATFTSVSQRPSFLYRLGFLDKFTYDTIRYRTLQITRSIGKDFSASSGIRIKDISASLRYGRTIDNNIYTYDINGDRSIVWPEVSLSLGRIEKLLFGLATSSDISTSYKLEQRNSGTILGDTFRTEGKQKSMSKSFAPLLSWQTTWKSRLSTNISANYSQSSNDLSLISGTASSITTQSGANASLTYTFSATKGIPLPFLKRVRLSSDLSFTWNLRYDKTLAVNRDYLGNESQSRNDRNIGTNVATSYRLSNSVESGITAGYTAYSDIQRGRTTKNVDLNFWVLFKF
jgi:hypothetical protein